MVVTLKPYHMLKNLFELIALKGHRDRKTLGMSACAQMQGLVLAPTASACAGANKPPGETVNISNCAILMTNRS